MRCYNVETRVCSSAPIKSGSGVAPIISEYSVNMSRMFLVYILKNEKTNKYYIGSTDNIKRRLKEHLAGKTRTTKILKTDKLVYTEKYKTLIEARNREKKLKSYKSKKYIEWLINKNLGQ
jgi:putative endonuclease